MGFLKDLWNDDKPCLAIFWTRRNRNIDSDKLKLLEQNKELKKQLETKKINAIDTDCELLE